MQRIDRGLVISSTILAFRFLRERQIHEFTTILHRLKKYGQIVRGQKSDGRASRRVELLAVRILNFKLYLRLFGHRLQVASGRVTPTRSGLSFPIKHE